ncbi:hypothetical protein H0H81_003864 [Sphagnurus paluster]|uniref:Protein kinase domain-containing protein n=1 Tax=Sphagnurus paluster TaxID=117069 RepID=A0A9P7FV43_9AGAR|nr:hypothetical protein H0H81_003864 [Sphagnurus paluster]
MLIMIKDSAIGAPALEEKGPSEKKPAAPMFNFSSEGLRNFTAADLIAILRMYRGKDEVDEVLSYDEAAERILATLSETDRRRVIFRQWPRAPNGKNITPDNTLPGKVTPNGIQLWGATIFDFYRVRRMPDVPGLSTITTGSKLMKWMKANDELQYAKDEIEWAESEDEPKVIEPWSPQEAIEVMEERIRRRIVGSSMPVPSDVKGKQASTGSPFDRFNYPEPWPLVPFSYPTESLSSLIPIERLPKKITVHDPWNLLAVNTRNRYGRAETRAADTTWTSKPDRTHIYNLKMSVEARLSAHSKEPQKPATPLPEGSFKVAGDEGQLEGYLLRPATTPGPIPPPIFVVHDPPPAPSNLDHSDEAHLYISPAHRVGAGNHSVVYEAEWELPRSTLFPPPRTNHVLCDICVRADVARILREVDGEHDERKEQQWKDLSANMRVVLDGRPDVTFNLVHASDFEKGKKGPQRQVTARGSREYRVEFEGRVRPIRTTIAWQDPKHPTCEHVKPPPVVPPTVKVRVMAKLSNNGDSHLVREARNYQRFEKHFFEHWSGFNVLPPMHDPVPVGALVPQFYGYYEPVPESEEQKREERRAEVRREKMKRAEKKREEKKREKERCEKEREEKERQNVKEDIGSKSEEEGVDMKEKDDEQKNETKDIVMKSDEEDDDMKSDREDVDMESGRKDVDMKSDEGDAKSDDEEDVTGISDEEEDSKVTEPVPRGYLSPILLLEGCGKEWTGEKLTVDQKNEATSLMYRFHDAGWSHGSVYTRNVLVQPGPLNLPPILRTMEKPSFRLIDFGRSYFCEDEKEKNKPWTSDRYREDSAMEDMFGTRMF